MADDYSDLDLSNPTPVDPNNQGPVNKFLYNNLVPEYLKSEFYKPHINPDYDPKNPSKAKLGYTPGTSDFAAKALPDVLSWLSPAAKGAGLASKAIVPPLIAAKFPRIKDLIPKTLSQDNRLLLKEAIKNTPGAQLTSEGLSMPVRRQQQPSQAGKIVNSGGVFYEPKYDSPSIYGDDIPWGGPQQIEGHTLFRNPRFVSHDFVHHSGPNLFHPDEWEGIENQASEIDSLLNDPKSHNLGRSELDAFRKSYSPDLPPLSKELVHQHSSYIWPWNTEAAIAQKARDLGHDSIITFSEEHPSYEELQQGKPSLGEILDVRERRYPTPTGKFSLFPQYQSIIDKLKGQ